jgi:hypothetical protein
MAIQIYDNDGATFDRYTVVYLDEPERRAGLFAARAMSQNPSHPQGFGQYCTAMPGKHLGRSIELTDLPLACQRLVHSDLGD